MNTPRTRGSRPFRSMPLVLAALLALLWRPAPADDLILLSDEFADRATLGQWQRVHQAEQWNAEQLELLDIDDTLPGRLVMMPYTCTWFQDFRGPLVFKTVAGDLAVTAEVHVTGRDTASPPRASFSLAGLMLRTARQVTPATWTSGGENYVFLSIGHGDNSSGTDYQFEVKTTVDSRSTLSLSPLTVAAATLQLVRLGDYVIALRQVSGQPWAVHWRYVRRDFPADLQLGLVTYTDWSKVQDFDPFVHNGTVLDPPLPPAVSDPNPGRPFAPDLIASFEYVRLSRPVLPEALEGLDLADPAEVTDEELLAFLGDNALPILGDTFESGSTAAWQ